MLQIFVDNFHYSQIWQTPVCTRTKLRKLLSHQPEQLARAQRHQTSAGFYISGSNAKDTSEVPDAQPNPWRISGIGDYLGLQWVECHIFSLCHIAVSLSTLKCMVLANCFCQRLNTFYSQHTKASLCNSARNV